MVKTVLLLLFVFAAAAGEELPVGTEDFDTILTQIGIGKWNVLYYLTVAYWRIVLPYHAFGGAFFAPYVNHTCLLPTQDLEPTIVVPNNVTTAAQNATINTIGIFPKDTCSYLKEDTTTGRLEEVPCTEWDYDNSTFSSTVTSEFNLVCERQYLRAAYQSMYMGGFLVGSFFNGYLAYRYGRLTVIATSSVIYSAIALGSAWLPSLESLLVFRFLLGTMQPTTLATGFVIVMEVTEIKWRATMSILTGIMWPVGTALYGLFAYLERDWRWLQTYVSLFCPVLLPFFFLLDESPRWLVVKGYHDKALSVLRRAARMNKRSLPPTEQLLAIMKKVQQQAALSDAKTSSQPNTNVVRNMLKQVALMFSTRKLITITVVSCVGFFSVAMIFFGVTLAAPALGIDDPFLFMVITGVLDGPTIIGIVFMEKFGRKKYGIFIFTLCAFALLLQPLVPADMQWLSMTLVMIGRMAAASAFDIMFLYTSELYPTEVRTQGMSVGLMSSRVGAFISPFIMSALEPNHPWAIFVVFGLMAALAAVSFLPLWETVNTCLPDTIAQMEVQKTPDDHNPKSYELVAANENAVTSA